MAGSSLLALIDDIATILDDVALLTKVAATPEWKEYMEKGAFNPTFMTGKPFADWLTTAEATHRTLMSEAGFLASNK